MIRIHYNFGIIKITYIFKITIIFFYFSQKRLILNWGIVQLPILHTGFTLCLILAIVVVSSSAMLLFTSSTILAFSHYFYHHVLLYGPSASTPVHATIMLFRCFPCPRWSLHVKQNLLRTLYSIIFQAWAPIIEQWPTKLTTHI